MEMYVKMFYYTQIEGTAKGSELLSYNTQNLYQK